MATKMTVRKKKALKAKTTRAIDVQERDVFVLFDVARVVFAVGVRGRASVIHADTGRVGAIAVEVLQKRHLRLGENNANAVIRSVVKRYPELALMYGLAEEPEERA
jgi:hypothetical protein